MLVETRRWISETTKMRPNMMISKTSSSLTFPYMTRIKPLQSSVSRKTKRLSEMPTRIVIDYTNDVTKIPKFSKNSTVR